MSTKIKKLTSMALAAILIMSCKKEQHINESGNLVPKTVAETTGLPFINANGAKLHSEAFGHPDSTMIVFLHGGPGGDYRGLLNGKQLAGHGYRVIFYDQRGSGLSERFSKKSYTSLGMAALDQMYDDLAAVIAHYRSSATQKVILVGHSWGGILATGYAAKYPNRIQGLVVVEPGGLKWNDIKTYTKESLAFGLWSELLNDATYFEQFVSGKENHHAAVDYKMAMMAVKNDITGEDNTQPASFWRYGAMVNAALFEVGEDHAPDFSAGIQQFHVPVLFLYSERNKAYPDSWAQKMAGAYYTTQRYRVNGTGHAGIFSDNSVWKDQTMPRLLQYFHSL